MPETKEMLFLGDPDSRVNQQIALSTIKTLQGSGNWILRMENYGTTPAALRRIITTIKPAAITMHVHLTAPMARYIMTLKMPRVCVAAGHNPTLALPLALPDNEGIGRMAAEYFLKRGYRHFGAFHAQTGYDDPRFKSFRSHLRRAGFEPAILLAPYGTGPHEQPFLSPRNPKLLSRWIRQLPKPCAIFGHSDNRAWLIVEACVRQGISVPDEVAVLGADDDPLLCCAIKPNLSSIHVPYFQIGAQAARWILSWDFAKPPGRIVQTIPPSDISERSSTESAVIADHMVAQAMDFIRRNIRRPISARDLQKLTGLSSQMLIYRFKAAINRTPMTEILRQRIQLGKRLLSETDHAMKIVAAECGFNSANRFYIAFKELTGISPSDYRRKMQIH